MPIAFPATGQVTILNDASKLYKVPGIQVQPNLGRPGVPFSQNTLAPGNPLTKARPNVRHLGFMYSNVCESSVVNPANARVTDGYKFNRVLGVLNMVLSGVSRDATGAVLAAAQVLIFRTEDKSLVAETVSDASGNWSVPMLKGGPFFYVEYKNGSPDVFGTSLHDRVPVQG